MCVRQTFSLFLEKCVNISVCTQSCKHVLFNYKETYVTLIFNLISQIAAGFVVHPFNFSNNVMFRWKRASSTKNTSRCGCLYLRLQFDNSQKNTSQTWCNKPSIFSCWAFTNFQADFIPFYMFCITNIIFRFHGNL